MNIALVHEYLIKPGGHGGAERVLDAIHDLFPKAPVFTLLHDEQRTQGRYKNWDIRASFLNRWPGHIRFIDFYRALMPIAVEQLNVMDYDVVISDSHSFAKGVITRQDAVHICYCHTPTRFVWLDQEEHIKRAGFRLTAGLARKALAYVKKWDFLAADRVDVWVANSETVKKRIEKFYGKKVDAVIHPPVDTDRFKIGKPGNYFLIVSRFEPHKKVRLAVEAFNKLGLPLKIVGTGKEDRILRRMAKENIEFLGPRPDREVASLMSRCKAFIFPQEEDFGITAVEAQAAGRPVIAYRGGGAEETILDGRTGVFFDKVSVDSLVDAVESFRGVAYTPIQIRQHAKKFDTAVFKRKMNDLIRKEAGKYGT
jgi:glycosyltransferase involved in cell wall biosynthesis